MGVRALCFLSHPYPFFRIANYILLSFRISSSATTCTKWPIGSLRDSCARNCLVNWFLRSKILFCADHAPFCLTPSSGPCGIPERIPHGKYIGSSFKFNAQLRYVCDKGYMLRGPGRRICGKHGMWSKAPTCIKGMFHFKKKKTGSYLSNKLDVPADAFMWRFCCTNKFCTTGTTISERILTFSFVFNWWYFLILEKKRKLPCVY